MSWRSSMEGKSLVLGRVNASDFGQLLVFLCIVVFLAFVFCLAVEGGINRFNRTSIVEDIERGNYTVLSITRSETKGWENPAKNFALMFSSKDEKDIKYFVLSDECVSTLFNKEFPQAHFVNGQGDCEWKKLLVSGH